MNYSKLNLRHAARIVSLALIVSPALIVAQPSQDAPPPPPPAQQEESQAPAPRQPQEAGGLDQYGQPVQRGPQALPPQDNRQPQYQRPMLQDREPAYRPAPQQPVPAQLTIRPGTYVTVRVNQFLSSDHNQQGDAFQATLVKPVVVDGIVVAERGQTLGGRVVEAHKAGRVQGTSKLAIQLTDLSLVDGQQVPIQSQLIGREGGTAIGRDAAGIGGATAAGAAIGAAADWGRGAAIGAGAGAVAGIIGVLVTRGPATIVDPESVLTFRVEAPIAISTERASYAFRPVSPRDYETGAELRTRVAPRPQAPGYYYGGAYGNPYAYAYPYPYFGGFSLYYGPRYFYGRGYYRGFRR